MRKVVILFAVALSLVMPTAMHAGEYYFGAQGGGNFVECEFLKKRHFSFDSGYNAGAVGGYAWCQGWRVEGELTFRDNRLHGRKYDSKESAFHGHVNTWSLMANGYYDFSFWSCWCISPYVGVGIGEDHVHHKLKLFGKNHKRSDNGFAWQMMGGLNYAFYPDFVLSVEYKFHDALLRHHHWLQNHSITIGIKFFCPWL